MNDARVKSIISTEVPKIIANIKEGDNKRKMPLSQIIITTVTILLSALALIVSILALRNSEAQTNISSFFYPSNIHLSWGKGDKDFVPKVKEISDSHVFFTSQTLTIETNAGAIKKASIIYCLDKEIGAIMTLDLSKDVTITERDGSSLALYLKEFTQYAMAEGPSSSHFETPGTSLFSSIFLVVEDYTGCRELFPVVFEYQKTEASAREWKYNVREYQELDLLWALSEPDGRSKNLPPFDCQVLEDGLWLREMLDRLSQ